MSLADWLAQAVAALRTGSSEPEPSSTTDLPSDGWEMIESSNVPPGFGLLRRGETTVRFPLSLWRRHDHHVGVCFGPGVRVDVDGWVPGRDGPEPAALVIPHVDVFVEPNMRFEEWQACFSRQGLVVKPLVDHAWADGPMRAIMYGQLLVLLANEGQTEWLRRFDPLDVETQAARWLGVRSAGPAMTFSSVVLECNRAAATAGLAHRLFRLVSYGDLVALKLPVPTCAELVLAGALEIVIPRTEEDDEHQWRHFMLAALASMADETGHRELASVLYVEALELAERAARSDVHGPWGDDVKAIAAMQARRPR